MEGVLAAAEYLKAEARVLVYEGGKVDNPRDPGGRTNQGVTQNTYNAYRRSKGMEVRDVYVMNFAERDDIYKALYWDKVDGDQLPAGLDFAVFDAGVNSGCGQAIKWLQAALGSVYTGIIDGQIGLKTIQAVTDFGDVSALIEEFCSRRLGTLKRLKTWSTFGKGWHARISNVQKIGVEWAQSDAGAPLTILPVDVTALGGHQKAPVNDNLKPPLVSQLATHVTTGGATASAAIVQAQTGLQSATMFTWVPYALGGLAVTSVVVGILVKIAADANDAAQKGVAKSIVDPDADAAGVPVAVDDLKKAA